MGNLGFGEILLLLILGLVAYGIFYLALRKPPQVLPSQGPTGVAGWLLLLVLGLVLFGPLLGFGQMNNGFHDAESRYPALITMGKWNQYKVTTWAFFCLLSTMSVYAGVGLMKFRTPLIVRQAKMILWLIGPVEVLTFQIALPLVFGGAHENDPIQFLVSSVWAGVWTLYLSNSKRVRSTYGIES